MNPIFRRIYADSTHLWRKVRYPFGYILFIGILTYGILNAPDEIWSVEPEWMLASFVLTLLLFIMQQWQVRVFLKANSVDHDWHFPTLLNARRGILNTIFPAKTGTLALLHTISSKYGIKWQDFLYFSILTSILSVYISLLALSLILLPTSIGTFMIVATLIISTYIYQSNRFIYAHSILFLLFIACAIFMITIGLFMCILMGLGYQLPLISITYFAIILNILAQVSITPGNIGVREAVLASASPYLDLPISVGIIAGSILLIIRLIVYGAIWGIAEIYRTE